MIELIFKILDILKSERDEAEANWHNAIRGKLDNDIVISRFAIYSSLDRVYARLVTYAVREINKQAFIINKEKKTNE